MNVGINFYMGAEREGIGWTITELVRQLLRAPSAHRFTLFTNVAPESIRAELGRGRPVDIRSFAMPSYTLWEQLALPVVIGRAKVDVFHSPAGLPLMSPTAGIATIHDLCFLTHPATFSPRMQLYFRVFFPLSVRKARLVLTVSNASREALVKGLRVREDKVRVVPNGVGEEFRPIEDPDVRARVRARYGLPAAFILHVGTLQPRKNVLALLMACRRLWTANRSSHPLVLVGKRGWLTEEIFDFVTSNRLEHRVIFTGYVSRADLPAVYSAASVFVYPSVCEGFGLPVVEAMACGTPVIVSRATALPEVVGDAGDLVEPDDIGGLADAIADVLGDERRQQTFRARGLERAQRYRWDTAARSVLEVYEEVAGRTR